MTKPPPTTARQAFLRGCRAPMGGAVVIIAASYLPFGAFIQESGLPIWAGPLLTGTVWALPGQILFVEMLVTGAPVFAIMLAVSLSNARFMPMVVSIMPLVRDGRRRPLHFFAAHISAVMSWTLAMRDLPSVPRPLRLSYYLGVALVFWVGAILFTTLGYVIAEPLPPEARQVVLLLVFAYLWILFADQRNRAFLFAVGMGAVAGPLIYLATPNWTLLITGVVFGSLAFLLDSRLARRRAQSRDG
ncbi:MAG: AzlC family ABC transporter permease [Alphaproteobacteria bacterium]